MAQESMKALRQHKDGLKIEDAPIPTPDARDVLIKVQATSITANELHWTETIARDYPIPGHDVAGTVAAVGTEVTGFTKGDEVFALTSFSRDGAAAEYMVASFKEVAMKPNSLSFEDAAAVPLSALWAWQALFQHADAKAGQKVLVTGAGGGVGVMVVQTAKWAELIVSATCSAAKEDIVRSLGARETYDYNKVAIEELSHDYDLVIDCVGGRTLGKSLVLLKGGGQLISVAREPTDDEKAQRSDVKASFFIVEPNGQELTRIVQLCDKGLLKPVVQNVMSLDEGVKAFEMLANGHTKGKIILKVGEPV